MKREKTKEAARKELFGANSLRASVRAGSKLEVIIGNVSERPWFDGVVMRFLMKGHSVKHSDGRVQRIHNEEVTNQGQTGSARYVWHTDGNRVKHERVLYTEVDGVTTREVIGSSWRVI